MGFENVESIFIDNKEVQSIVVKDNGGILFQKSNDIINLPIMELEIQHNLNIYLHNPFTYTGRVFVDWGDNTGLIEYTGGELTHTYNSIDNYTVKIYGNITSLETSCFESCNGLTSITIPNSVTNLGEACFHSCRDLTSISIPSSVTSIGDYCFTACESLTSISIPSGVTSLGTFCFSRCESLTSINIPSGITSLGAYCFEGCTSLTSIVIPNTVTFIGEYCFVACYALTNIKLNFKTSINILAYDSSWIIETNNLKFSIPNDTTSLYTDKGYPLEKLEEENHI